MAQEAGLDQVTRYRHVVLTEDSGLRLVDMYSNMPADLRHGVTQVIVLQAVAGDGTDAPGVVLGALVQVGRGEGTQWVSLAPGMLTVGQTQCCRSAARDQLMQAARALNVTAAHHPRGVQGQVVDWLLGLGRRQAHGRSQGGEGVPV